MALPDVTFVVAPNPDTNTQQLSDPGGTTPPDDPLENVTNFSITENKSTEQTVSWSYSGTNHTSFEVAIYDGSAWPSAGVDSTARSYTYSPLPAATLIKWRIRALNATSQGAWAFAEQQTLPADGGGTDPGGPPIEGDSDIAGIVAAGGRHWDFENGSNGDPISAVEPEINGATQGTISTSHAASGTRSFQTYINPGQGGYGEWGGILGEVGDKPPRMKRNGEIWLRWYNYFPSDWQNETDPRMKWMRIQTVKADGDGTGGYNDMYLNGTVPWYTSETMDLGDATWHPAPSIYSLKRGQWECWEMYVYLDTVPKDQGGKAEAIFWKNGVRCINATNLSTMRDANGWSTRILWHTWHQHNDGEGGGASQRYYSWLDNWTMAFRGPSKDHGTLDCTPWMQRDSQNHPIIGTAT